jgi:hypothetical protein
MAGRPHPSFAVEDAEDDQYDPQQDGGDDDDEQSAEARAAAADEASRNALLHRVFSAVATAGDWSVSAFKWGWLPLTLAMGLTNAYCRSERPAFYQFRGQ